MWTSLTNTNFDDIWPSALSQRNVLGDFISVYCLETMMDGLQDILGAAATAALLTHAGRLQGGALIEEWTSVGLRPCQLTGLFNTVLGYDGLRLCRVEHIDEDDTEHWVHLQVSNIIGEHPHHHGKNTIIYYSEDTEEIPVSLYPFTLGILWGVLEKLTGRSYHAQSDLEFVEDIVVFSFHINNL